MKWKRARGAGYPKSSSKSKNPETGLFDSNMNDEYDEDYSDDEEDDDEECDDEDDGVNENFNGKILMKPEIK